MRRDAKITAICAIIRLGLTGCDGDDGVAQRQIDAGPEGGTTGGCTVIKDGQPIFEDKCKYVLRYGYQRQQTAAAIELAMMKPCQPLFEVRAPVFRQQKLLDLK